MRKNYLMKAVFIRVLKIERRSTRVFILVLVLLNNCYSLDGLVIGCQSSFRMSSKLIE